ncbi:hypothetical protein FHS97_001737 [Sphingomonas endophytica]|uniref:Peptidase M16 N-terminal domain-containing protein n=1 Tax=Sphingomonas endophytica TaxID=869719 RepID=A0ABR6N4U6_9SPHN|nr:insulinase family protein [Sphingomonas endophytica]MBB5725805.1 hypothetical protein [Sphingomonas endophytica]
MGAVAATAPADPLVEARAWRLESGALAAAVDVDCRREVLGNGLTVLLQPDTSTALVHVSVGYRVGSMEEGVGQTGLAHFMEHLMFAGTHALPGSYVTRMMDAGATSVNATTGRDMTRYFRPSLRTCSTMSCSPRRTAWPISPTRLRRRSSSASAMSCRRRSGRTNPGRWENCSNGCRRGCCRWIIPTGIR